MLPLGPVLDSVPDKHFPFPGQENSPLQHVEDKEWAPIQDKTRSRLERKASSGMIHNTRRSLFASARKPALA